MKKKILIGIAAVAVATIAAVNVNYALQGDDLSELSVANLEALAQESGNTRDCPGGSCSYSNPYSGNCTACCPSGKNPRCDSFGCTCIGW
jgi:hypothetical protein